MFNNENVQQILNAIIEQEPRHFWISLRTIEKDFVKSQQDGFQIFSMGFKGPVEEAKNSEDDEDSFSGSMFDL